MGVRSTDICIILGYRITENEVFIGEETIDKYFNIRDNLGRVYGRNFNTINEPLDLLFDMENKLTNLLKLDEMAHGENLPDINLKQALEPKKSSIRK